MVGPAADIAAEISRWLGDSCAEEPRYSMVGGGCVHAAARISCADQSYFVKWATDVESGRSFQAEAAGLAALAAAGAVRTPSVLRCAERWLLLEWLPPQPATIESWRELGRGLARLHRVSAPHFGWTSDNFIGALPQANQREAEWAIFWREQRLEAQLRLEPATRLLSSRDRAHFRVLFERLPELLGPGQQDEPSLLHGDLWSGNAHSTLHTIALIDPSVYYGHREVDLAMADLFGGFAREFRAAYEAEWPVRAAGRAQRRACYQLYYLLVHVNMFGASYLTQTRAALASALS